MDRVEECVELFSQGHTCSQAIFAVFSRELGVNRDTALKLSCSFGGGMGGMGLVCGAVTGAYMAISLKYGRSSLSDKQARNESDALIRLFTAKFKERHADKLNCNDLLGFDRSDAQDVRILKERGVFAKKCPAYVKDAAEILEQIFQSRPSRTSYSVCFR